jgi:hypothetical protein
MFISNLEAHNIIITNVRPIIEIPYPLKCGYKVWINPYIRIYIYRNGIAQYKNINVTFWKKMLNQMIVST